MRLLSLRLHPYGAFLDAGIAFSAFKRVHIVYGENEGGKSTRRDAIEDLFFGFPLRSRYGFLAPLNRLRIEASLDIDGITRAIVRLKRNRESLVDETEKPIPEDLLKGWLGGRDRVSYRQRLVFTRDQLREGGDFILRMQGNLAATLYGAAFAGGDPREVLKRLDGRMSELFSPATQAKKILNGAIAQFGRCTTASRNAVVLPERYNGLIKQREAIDEEIAELQHAAARVGEESARFARIANAIELHIRYCSERERFAAIAEGVQLSRTQLDSVSTHLAAVVDAEKDAKEALRELERLDAEQQPVVDERLLEHKPAIAAAFARLETVRAGLEDISANKLDRRLEEATETLAQIARELWPKRRLDEARDDRPTRESIERFQAIANQYGGLAANHANAEKAVVARRKERERLKSLISSTDSAPDLTALSAVLADAKKLGDVAARGAELDAEIARLVHEREAIAQSLPYVAGGLASIQVQHVPAREVLEELRARFRTSDDELRDAIKTREDAEAEIRRLDDEMRSEGIQSAIELTDEMEATRRRRRASFEQINEGWRKRHPYSSEVVAEYRASAEGADKIADTRFGDAARVAIAERLRGERGRAKRRLEDLQARLKRLTSDREELESDWTRRWYHAGIARPGEVAAMIAWLGNYDDLRARDLTLVERQRERAQLGESAAQAVAAIRTELRHARVHEPGDDDRSLATISARAEELLKRVNDDAAKRREQLNRLGDVDQDLERLTQDVQLASDELATWRMRWSACLDVLKLSLETAPASAPTISGSLAEFDRAARQYHQNRVRIAGIRRDADRYRSDVRPILLDAAPDLLPLFEVDFGQAVNALYQRSEEAITARAQAERTRDGVARQQLDFERKQARLTGLRNELASDAAACGFALDQAGETLDAARRRLDVLAALENAGERLQLSAGTTCEEYDAHVASLTYEGIRTRVLQLVDEKDEVTRRHTERIEARSAVQAEIDGIDGSDEATSIAEELQSLVGTIDRTAREYAALAVARTVFERELARFAEANQGPLIDSASRYFSELTYGRYESIRVAQDDSGAAELELRGPHGLVDVGALSDGTADQLFFALRLAAIDEYLVTAPPVPVVIDDAFVNFDDARTLAGMKALGDLGRRTQVIYFTHHRRAAEFAVEALGDDAEIIELGVSVVSADPDREQAAV